MPHHDLLRWAIVLLLLTLACTAAQVTPQPAAEVDQITFDVQTATPTVGLLFDAPTYTPDPRFTATPLLTATLEITNSLSLTSTTSISATAVAEAKLAATATPKPAIVEPPTPTPAPTKPPAEPIRGGAWDFEEGFTEWRNPHGDQCPGSGLANGWVAFGSKDQYGSSCMNKTDWQGNVFSGTSAQEITFAYVGVEAGIFRTAPTIPGHTYTVEAFMRREFSVAKVEVALGLDPTGGGNWQAESVQWFPWGEDLDDQWARTEATITATSENLTVFIKGNHPYPEPGGTLRLDAISLVDNGLAQAEE